MDDHEKDVNDGSYDGQDEEVEEDLSQTHQVPNDALAQTSNSIEYRWVEEISSHPVGGTGPSPGGLALATLKQLSHSGRKPVALKHPTQPRQTKTIKQPQSLQFVVENGQRRPDGLSRRRIRSQARRKVENKLEHETEGFHIITPRKEKAVISLSGTKSGLGSDASLCKGLWDPFDALPVDRDWKAQLLMHHFNSSMALNIRRPVSPTKEWLLFAVTDPALLHSVLCHAAIDLSIINCKPLMLEGIYHKARAIEIINNRLKNNEQATSDATIAAVACLAYLECISSSPAGVKVHMDGLEAIIKRRGGLEAMSSNIIAWKFIFWVDACAAAVLKAKPRFIYPITTDADATKAIMELLAKIPAIRELLSRMQPNAESAALYQQIRVIGEMLS